MDGLILLNKEQNITSQGAVNRVKRLFGVKKAGHTGTLDPMATGVLPVLVGRAVKASEYMIGSTKHYVATLLLGITTDTEDVTGETLTACDVGDGFPVPNGVGNEKGRRNAAPQSVKKVTDRQKAV